MSFMWTVVCWDTRSEDHNAYSVWRRGYVLATVVAADRSVALVDGVGIPAWLDGEATGINYQVFTNWEHCRRFFVGIAEILRQPLDDQRPLFEVVGRIEDEVIALGEPETGETR